MTGKQGPPVIISFCTTGVTCSLWWSPSWLVFVGPSFHSTCKMFPVVASLTPFRSSMPIWWCSWLPPVPKCWLKRKKKVQFTLVGLLVPSTPEFHNCCCSFSVRRLAFLSVLLFPFSWSTIAWVIQDFRTKIKTKAGSANQRRVTYTYTFLIADQSICAQTYRPCFQETIVWGTNFIEISVPSLDQNFVTVQSHTLCSCI